MDSTREIKLKMNKKQTLKLIFSIMAVVLLTGCYPKTNNVVDDITLELIFTENQTNMSRLDLITYEKYFNSN